MRRLCLIALLCALFAATLPLGAQDSTPEAPLDAASRAETAALVAEDAALDARRYTEDAGNFLNVFEGVGVVLGVLTALIPVAALIAGFVGLNRLRAARADLTRGLGEARAELDKGLIEARQELATLRQTVNDELRAKQDELDKLKQELEASARDERVRSDQATLALSLLPLGERQYRVKDFDGAVNAYERALSLDKDNAVIHYRVGYVQTQQGKLDEATQHLTRALELDPTFEPALANLGYVLRRRAEKLPEDSIERGLMLAQAEERLRLALSTAPKLVDEDGESWWGSLGGLHRRRGQINDAIDAYRRAKTVTPQASYPVGNLALLHLENGDTAQMRESYQQAERLAYRRVLADGGDGWAWADLLVAQLALGKYDEAEETLTWVINLIPSADSYLLSVLLGTLRQLARLLGGEPAQRIQPFIDQLENDPSTVPVK